MRDLAKSRTAWVAIVTVVVSWLGRHIGLTDVEQATLLTGLQGLIVALKVDDHAKVKREKASRE